MGKALTQLGVFLSHPQSQKAQCVLPHGSGDRRLLLSTQFKHHWCLFCCQRFKPFIQLILDHKYNLLQKSWDSLSKVRLQQNQESIVFSVQDTSPLLQGHHEQGCEGEAQWKEKHLKIQIMCIYLCSSNIVKTFFMFHFRITKKIYKNWNVQDLKKYLSWDTKELTFDEAEFCIWLLYRKGKNVIYTYIFICVCMLHEYTIVIMLWFFFPFIVEWYFSGDTIWNQKKSLGN